jgi:NAD(P)H-dependent FMN reductase
VLNLKIVIGSTRDGRAADRVVPWLTRRIESNNAFAMEMVDLREWRLPIFAETLQTVGDLSDPAYSQPLVRSWNDTMRCADAFVFVTPEYNHSVPGVLKNAIDNLFFSFALRNKPAGLIGYSGGAVGGARSVEHLAQILIEAEAVPLRNTVLIPSVQDAFAGSGEPVNPATDVALEILLEDLEWWGRILADARPSSLPHALMRMTVRARRQQTAS